MCEADHGSGLRRGFGDGPAAGVLSPSQTEAQRALADVGTEDQAAARTGVRSGDVTAISPAGGDRMIYGSLRCPLAVKLVCEGLHGEGLSL